MPNVLFMKKVRGFLRWPILALGLGCALSLFVLSSSVRADSELKQLFLHEAPSHWQAYAAFIDKLQGSYTIKTTQRSQIRYHRKVEVKQNRDCKLFHTQSLLPSSPDGELVCVNPTYSFKLRKKSKERPWALVVVEKRDSGRLTHPGGEIVGYHNLLNLLVRARATKLVDLVQRPTFKVLSARQVQAQGETLVEIKFDNQHPLDEKGKPFCPEQSGTLLLDPKRSWCLRGAEIECLYSNGKPIVQIKTEVFDSDSKFPLPKRIVHEDSSVAHIISEFVFSLQEPSALPSDDEFRLSAFGFPEPFETGSRPTPWHLWLGVAAIVCIVAGIAFRCLKHRLIMKSV